MVDGRFFGHFFWKVVGSCAHTCESHTATTHGAPYTVNSRVVVGAIYAYMCVTRCFKGSVWILDLISVERCIKTRSGLVNTVY